MLKEKIKEIEVITNQKLESIFKPLQKEYSWLYDYLKKEGSKYLEDVNLSIEEINGKEVIVIEDQQLDYLLIKEMDNFLLFYRKEGNIQEINYVYHYPELHHFYIIFESLLMELGKEKFKNDEMIFYDLQIEVGEKFDSIFAQQEDFMLSTPTIFKENPSEKVFLERIKIYKDTILDGELDSIFEKFFKFKKQTQEEREESIKRDALVIKGSNDAFILVFHTIFESDITGKRMQLDLCYTKEEDDNFPNLEFFLNNYTHYKSRPIYSYRYSQISDDKEIFSDLSSSLFYFNQLEKFFQLWEEILQINK